MPHSTTIYRNTGESVDLDHYIDAREAVENHPEEWSFNPFGPEDVKATLLGGAQQDMAEPV